MRVRQLGQADGGRRRGGQPGQVGRPVAAAAGGVAPQVGGRHDTDPRDARDRPHQGAEGRGVGVQASRQRHEQPAGQARTLAGDGSGLGEQPLHRQHSAGSARGQRSQDRIGQPAGEPRADVRARVGGVGQDVDQPARACVQHRVAHPDSGELAQGGVGGPAVRGPGHAGHGGDSQHLLHDPGARRLGGPHQVGAPASGDGGEVGVSVRQLDDDPTGRGRAQVGHEGGYCSAGVGVGRPRRRARRWCRGRGARGRGGRAQGLQQGGVDGPPHARRRRRVEQSTQAGVGADRGGQLGRRRVRSVHARRDSRDRHQPGQLLRVELLGPGLPLHRRAQQPDLPAAKPALGAHLDSQAVGAEALPGQSQVSGRHGQGEGRARTDRDARQGVEGGTDDGAGPLVAAVVPGGHRGRGAEQVTDQTQAGGDDLQWHGPGVGDRPGRGQGRPGVDDGRPERGQRDLGGGLVADDDGRSRRRCAHQRRQQQQPGGQQTAGTAHARSAGRPSRCAAAASAIRRSLGKVNRSSSWANGTHATSIASASGSSSTVSRPPTASRR